MLHKYGMEMSSCQRIERTYSSTLWSALLNIQEAANAKRIVFFSKHVSINELPVEVETMLMRAVRV